MTRLRLRTVFGAQNRSRHFCYTSRALIHAALFLALCSAQPETAMERAIHEYFEGEIERGASLGMAMGVSSLIAAPLLLFATDSEFLEGAAYPIAVFGILEIIVASVIYWRT